jgi:MoxR-like ATPase
MSELVALQKRVGAIDPDVMNRPDGYVMEDNDLRSATNTALILGKPLFLTGEAGVGKSQFANWLAHELSQESPTQLFKFVVKSTTEARDLFYHYDALARFHEAQILEHSANSASNNVETVSLIDPYRYISYNALGRAIICSMGGQTALECKLIASHMSGLDEWVTSQPSRSVVLIDEIDKAPRDVPNDILDEIDNLAFRIRELGDREAKVEKQHRPVIVITSNSERDMPKPFLRRCVYYHMPFPREEQLLAIALARVGSRFSFSNGIGLLSESLRLFKYLRSTQAGLRRAPGLAELLDWLHTLAATGEGNEYDALHQVDQLQARVMASLIKDPSDQIMMRDNWSIWLSQALEQAHQDIES